MQVANQSGQHELVSTCIYTVLSICTVESSPVAVVVISGNSFALNTVCTSSRVPMNLQCHPMLRGEVKCFLAPPGKGVWCEYVRQYRINTYICCINNSGIV